MIYCILINLYDLFHTIIDETNPLQQHIDATNYQNSNVSSKKWKIIDGVNEYRNSIERVVLIFVEKMKNIDNLLSRSITKEWEQEKKIKLYDILQSITSLSN